jgi:hypothetical protein
LAENYKWPVVKVHTPPKAVGGVIPKWDMESVKESAALLSPTVSEGYVLCDKYFHRIKVKVSMN